MFKRFGICALAATTVLLAGSRVRADDAADIRASGKAFVEAFTAGDAAGAKKYAVTDAKSDKFLDIWSEIAKANKALTDAAVAKFGDAGNQVAASGGMGMQKPQILSHFENAKIDVSGDTAVVTPTTGKPVKMKKDGGRWKIDFTNDASFDRVDQQAAVLTKMAEANNKSAQEISSGKYSTVDEAKVGVRANLIAAIQNAIPRR